MGRKLPPLNALKGFEAAARLSSFSGAAKELFVTHGAISQQIKLLEDYFQQPLFIRSHRKVRVTEAGADLLPIVSNALDRIEKGSARLVNNKDLHTLTINLTATFASQWLIPRLAGFEHEHPDIILRLSPSIYFSGEFDDQADIAIRWGGARYPSLQMERLFYVDTFCACAPSLMEGAQRIDYSRGSC
jgi:LysR family glycine cleavage system transcriptional activator